MLNGGKIVHFWIWKEIRVCVFKIIVKNIFNDYKSYYVFSILNMNIWNFWNLFVKKHNYIFNSDFSNMTSVLYEFATATA